MSTHKRNREESNYGTQLPVFTHNVEMVDSRYLILLTGRLHNNNTYLFKFIAQIRYNVHSVREVNIILFLNFNRNMLPILNTEEKLYESTTNKTNGKMKVKDKILFILLSNKKICVSRFFCLFLEFYFLFCGPQRTRTAHLLSANEALYQMS